MRPLSIVLLLVVAPAFLACAMTPDDGRVASPSPPDPGGGFAVVELFTSEGCSSCPPADAVASRLAKSKKSDTRRLSMTVEEGLKMVISGGLVTPPDRRSAERRAREEGAAQERELAEPEAGRPAPSTTLVSGSR